MNRQQDSNATSTSIFFGCTDELYTKKSSALQLQMPIMTLTGSDGHWGLGVYERLCWLDEGKSRD
jgi:hypothetical protein